MGGNNVKATFEITNYYSKRLKYLEEEGLYRCEIRPFDSTPFIHSKFINIGYSRRCQATPIGTLHANRLSNIVHTTEE